MNENNDFALVRKPSRAVEKAAPGAKRILSGMVVDALALAKPAFTVFMCGAELTELVEEIIKNEEWAQKYSFRFIRFNRASELLRLAQEQPFDLIFLYFMDVRWDTDANDPFLFLGRLKAQYGKTIVATQGMDLRKQFEGTGVTFLEAPFSVDEFKKVVRANLPTHIANTLAIQNQTNFPKPRGKVLIVHPEDGPRQSLRVIFQNEYDLLMAEDGPTAFELAQKHDIDVTVTHIRMPGMSGIELLERLKLLKPDMEVIMMTAFETTDTLVQALRLRAFDYINMPFEIETMRSAVSKAIQRRILESDKAAARKKSSINSERGAKQAQVKRRDVLLIVDDEDGPRQSLRVIFQDEYDLVTAEDGPTAIKLAQENEIDVAVLNIRMPGMSGIEVLERLKYVNPDIEVIMTTGFVTNDTILQALRLRAFDYITKPFDIETMRSAVSKAIHRRKHEAK